jgi:hypothetical protein
MLAVTTPSTIRHVSQRGKVSDLLLLYQTNVDLYYQVVVVQPPPPPPSLQMRVGGGLFLVFHHPFPLPRFKRESEGGFLVFTHPFHHPTPSLASNVSQRGCVTTCHITRHHPFHPPPSLQKRVLTHHVRHHPFPLPRSKSELEGAF